VEEHGSFGQDADPRNILLTITPSTIIDGEPIMEGFMSKMEEKVDRDIEYDNALFRKCESTQSARMAGALKTARYTYARGTAYSSKAVMSTI